MARTAFRKASVAALLAVAIGVSLGANKWSRYEHEMQDPVDDPADAARPGEFTFARLRYRSSLDGRRGGYHRWGIDCNKGDRLFIQSILRLTRIDTAPIETIIDVEDDDIFNWPYVFAVSAGDWRFTAPQAERLRKYLAQGGFLMVDDFHGDGEWQNFLQGIRQIAPGAEIVELEDPDPIFHVVWNMKDRIQVPGANVVHGPGYERGGVVPHWRGVVDPRGRIIVAICFNMDVGDGWEFADDPGYPEKFSYEALRLGINYVTYAMTH
jgi:hypothetical protein